MTSISNETISDDQTDYINYTAVIIKFTFFMNTVQFKFILQNLNLVQFKFSIFLGIIIELSSVHLKK